MISPAGFTDKIEGFKQENYKFREGFTDHTGKPIKPIIPKLLSPLSGWIWKNRISPYAAIRKLPNAIGRKYIVDFLDDHARLKKQFADKAVLKDILIEYLYQMLLMLPGTTETALMVVLENEAFAHYPLTGLNRLAKPKFPISFFYGTVDTMPSTGAEVIIGNIRKNFASDPVMMSSQIHLISRSGHDVQYDNPKELADKIIKDVNGDLIDCFELKM